MVKKISLLSHAQGSDSRSDSKPISSFKKRMQIYRPSKVTTGYHNNSEGPSSPTFSPRGEETRNDDSQRDSEYGGARRTQRPSIISRRVLHTKPMSRTEPSSHSMTSTMAVRCDSHSPSQSTARTSLAVKSQSPSGMKSTYGKPPVSPRTPTRANSPRTKRSSLSPKKSSRSLRSPKSGKAKTQSSTKSSEKYSKRTRASSKTRKTKSEPLLAENSNSTSDDEARIATTFSSSSSSTKKDRYNPPSMSTVNNAIAAVKGTQYQTEAEDQESIPPEIAAIANRLQARAEKQNRVAPLAVLESMSSGFMRRDRYMMEEADKYLADRGTNPGSPRYPTDMNSTFQSSVLSQGSGSTGMTSTLAGTFSSLVAGSPRDLTVGNETYGDEYTDADQTLSDDSKRSMRFGFSHLSDNTSFGEGSVIIKQQVAWGCIGLSALQFAILTTQVLLCGVAALSINPTLGPYPDAFSEWGGKNAYLLVEGAQYFRFITPIFLHVGYLHLLVNVFFQLESCAYLEREWGFPTWITIYLISGFGSCLTASAIDADVIGVCSSGAMMGLFGARISQAILWTTFETCDEYIGHGAIIFERLDGAVCSAAVVFFLTFLTYIDWSGHLGGLFTGFFAGLVFFSFAIRDRKTRVILNLFGLFGILFGVLILGVILFHYATPDEDLADVCSYFRNLYSEGYSCECQAFDRR